MQQHPQAAHGRPADAPRLSDLVGGLRDSWRATALSAGDHEGLAAFLDGRLDELTVSGRLDRASLTGVIDETADRLRAAGDGAVALVVRRLLRSIYEFLLAVDARAQLAAAGRLPDPEPAFDVEVAIDRASATAAPGTSGDVANAALVSPAVHHVELLLLGGRLGEAAELLSLLAGQGMGPWLVPVALAAGDRCRAAGLAASARDCYLAAWATDRTDEKAPWRLAELGLDAGDVDLAMSYLREVGSIREWRGDPRGVARVYRKMFTLGRALEESATAPPPFDGAPDP